MCLAQTSDQDDAGLISAATRCLNLSREHEELTRLDQTDGEDPRLATIDAEVCELSVIVRRSPATTAAGLRAKAALFQHFFADDQPPEPEYPIDAEMLGFSICDDVNRLLATLAPRPVV